MREPSGPQWCARFPRSVSVDDLDPAFRSGVLAFIEALHGAGAKVLISATYRPSERAALMHWACLIAGYRDRTNIFHQIAPDDVPEIPGVDIDWTHAGDAGAARAAAVQMKQGYLIAYPAALVSRHTQRKAIDMTISWPGELRIRQFDGSIVTITDGPHDGTNHALAVVSRTYGVIKLPSDPPHFSTDGH